MATSATSKPPTTTRVAYVDDHTLMRSGVEQLVNAIPGYKVVISASSGEELIARLNDVQADIALVDLFMPRMDGHQVIERLGVLWPRLRCLVVTFDATEEALARAIRLGARGYVLKDIEPIELHRALDAIRDTGYYHNELLDHHLRDHPDGYAPVERERNEVMEKLTPRLVEYLKLLADPRDLTNKQIAPVMGVEEGGVEACHEALRRKFGIRSKTGALLFAIKWGIVNVERSGGGGVRVAFPITPPNFRSKEILCPEVLARAD